MRLIATKLSVVLSLMLAAACSDSGGDETSSTPSNDNTPNDDTSNIEGPSDDDTSSSDVTDEPVDPNLPEVRELGTELASVQCELAVDCFGPFLKVALRGADCVTYFGRVAEDEGLNETERAVDEGRVEYHPERVQACADAVLANGCEQDNPQLPECEAVFEGSVPLGGECMIAQECEGEATCVVDNACPGECGSLRLAGDACRENSDCQAGLICSDETERCVAPVAAQGACGGGVEPECGGGLLCMGDDEEEGIAGTCRPTDAVFVAEVGASCDFQNALCNEDLSCVIAGSDPETGLITECAPTVAAGAACNVGIPTQCPEGYYCNAQPTLGEFEGICVPLPEAGEPCIAPLEGSACGAYAICNGENQCVAISRLGEPCETDDACYSGRCEAGACVSEAACP